MGVAKARFVTGGSGGGGSGNTTGTSVTTAFIEGPNTVAYSLSGGKTAKIVQFYIGSSLQPGGFQTVITSSTQLTVTSSDAIASVTIQIIGW